MKKLDLLKKTALVTLMILVLTGCANNQPADVNSQSETEENTESDETVKSGDITIVYTNDIHSYIDNVVKDDEGNVTGDGLRFSKIAAMVKDLRAEGGNVILVDTGDEIQGDIYGAMDEGETIIDLMNATGYQLATPGNHDFDYGMFRFLELVEKANYKYVTCNFRATDGAELKITGTHIFDIAGKKVAFVGVTTPEAITSSTPAYFQNEKGEFIYTIDGIHDPKDMIDAVQAAIDSVKDEADYVIGIGHIGVGQDEQNAGISCNDVIAGVSGLDAFISGHSHTTIEGKTVKDKDGKDVLLTQTGCYLQSVGVMTISEDGTVSTKLVNDYDREDENVAKIEQDYIQSVYDKMSEQVGVLESTLYICNPDNNKERWIRAKEMNSGDFTADSVYWFFNERIDMQCDVAIQNGGGIRSQIEKGDINYLSAKQIEPFGNMICLISATGQQIIDALEMGATEIGNWDDEWNIPSENGGFLQVAGLTYTIDASVPSSVKTDQDGLFTSVDGEYKVRDVKVYNRETCEYEDIDPEKYYQIGGLNYILRNSGNGLCMFKDDELTIDYVGQDYIILAEYIKSFADKEGDLAYVNTKNSPLSKYDGYLIDYENPFGAGRINIINTSY